MRTSLFFFIALVLWCCSSYEERRPQAKQQQPQYPLHTHLAKPTPVSCSTTEDCLEYFSGWCQSGTFCSRGRCHTIPSYPCKADQRCDEVSRTCQVKYCKDWKDCDDGQFCNGVERCVAGVCTSDHKFDCTHGQCSEATQTCATPLSLRGEVERMKSVASEGGVRARKAGGIYIMDEPTAAPTNSTPTNDSTVYLTMWIVAAVIFGSGVILFIVFSIRGGGAEPYLIVVNNGDGGTPGEDPESNFQHQLHYSNQY